MILQKETPLIIEATTEKEFPNLWVYSFLVSAPSLTSGRAKFELLPYNSTTKELGEGKFAETIDVDDLFACVTEVPEAAQAYGAILAAIAPVRAWVKQKEEERKAALANPPVTP